MIFKNSTLFWVLLPMVLAGCASTEAPVKKEAQVSCAGQAPRVGTHIVRKADCLPLSPEEIQAQREKFEALQQAQEAERARRDAAPTPSPR